MKATIEINMDNAAFEDAPEIELARILRKMAKWIEVCGLEERKVIDDNGNLVGRLTIEED